MAIHQLAERLAHLCLHAMISIILEDTMLTLCALVSAKDVTILVIEG
jgi:hypothetical protein